MGQRMELPPPPDASGGLPPPALDPAAQWKTLAADEAVKRGFEPEYIQRLITAESNWDPNARSPKGALGIAQFMPETAKSLGIDPMDPAQAIPAAVSYMYGLHEQFGGDERAATAAYNTGAAAVQRYKGVPPFFETQDYLKKVLPEGSRARRSGLRMELPPPTATPTLSAAEAHGSVPRIGPEPPWWQSTYRTVLPAAGAMLGGIAGGAMGAPAGPVGIGTGAVAGAGVGGGIGEAASLGVDKLVGSFGASPVPPPTLAQAGQRMVAAPEAGMVAEATGRTGGAVLNAVTKPLTRTVTQEGREALKLFPDVEVPRAALSPARLVGSKTKTVPGLLPGQISNSRTLQIGQNVAEGSFLGGGRMAAVKRSQSPQSLRLAQDALEEFGVSSSPAQVGQAVQAAREGGLKTASKQGSAVYDKIWEAADKAKVEVGTDNLEAFIEKEPRARTALYKLLNAVAPEWNAGAEAGAQTASGLPGAPTRAQVEAVYGRSPKPVLQRVLKEMGFADEPTGGISLKAAHDLRSELLTAGRKLEATTQDVPAGYTKKLTEVIDADMHAAAGDLSPQLRSADAYWKTEVADRFKTTFLRGLAKKDPSKAALALAQPAVSVESLQQARGAVPPTVWRQVQRLKGDQIISKATTPDGHTIVGAELLDTLRTQKHQLREIYGDRDQALWRLGRALEQVQKKTDGTGGLYVKFAQASAATAALTFSGKPATGAILLTPALISRVMGSTSGMKLLAEGLDGFPKSQLVGKAGLHFLAQLTRDRDAEDAYEATEPPAMPSHGPPTRPGGLGPPSQPLAALGPPARP